MNLLKASVATSQKVGSGATLSVSIAVMVTGLVDGLVTLRNAQALPQFDAQYLINALFMFGTWISKYDLASKY